MTSKNASLHGAALLRNGRESGLAAAIRAYGATRRARLDEARRQRDLRRLLETSEHLVRDIGLDPGEVRRALDTLDGGA